MPQQTKHHARIARASLDHRQSRESQGHDLRTHCPRSSHAATGADRKRRDPLALIERSSVGRLPQLLPVRYQRMLESPLAFFRGTAIIQAHDLARTPSASITVQSCGDCHLMNFGAFASPERTLLFDINDFDETAPAPFEWDIKRLATSFALASRWRKFDKHDARPIASSAVKSYREHMAQFARMNMLDVWYARITIDDLLKLAGRDADLLSRVDRLVADAASHTAEAVFHKITRPAKGRPPRFVDQRDKLFHTDLPGIDTKKHIAQLFDAYRKSLPEDRRYLFDRYQFADAAFKVVGVGSVGTYCFATLWMADVDDPLFLQLKQAHASVLEGPAGKAKHQHHGERVVIGQRLMQSASDIFLGWTTDSTGKVYYVRQLRNQQAAPNIATMNPRALNAYAQLCGQALARAHAKSGQAATIAGYLGTKSTFDDAVTDYALAYAEEVKSDFHLFESACKAGRFPTKTLSAKTPSALR